ncbi:peroxidase 51-like [Typha latifolia]|uniref:peroxidase 51-like n=1 Tax=Typha latifolia TaxID=4733 RepID=UPI003C2B8CF0
MGGFRVAFLLLTLNLCYLCFFSHPGLAQLSPNYYATICPNVETIVRGAVTQKSRETVNAVGGVVRILFHDCFVEGCDASVLIASTSSNAAEKDHPDNLSLSFDGYDAVIRAKAAVDADPQCTGKVSCADILVMAARDAIALAGGPTYAVELGRLDGLSSTASSVNGKLPGPTFDLDQLTSLFQANGLSVPDLIALSAAHSVGVGHCSKFSNRLYNFGPGSPVDPTLNMNYAAQLMNSCPLNANTDGTVLLDPVTPGSFDNQYYKNLQGGMGLFSSDQVLFSDIRSRPIVDSWAQSSPAFQQAFVDAITKLGRVGVKTGLQGNIRKDCAVLN